jgi:PKD repeat protein
VKPFFCGDGYPWNDNLIYTPGTYSDDFEGANGCDSTVVLELTVIDEDFNLSFSSNQQLFTAPPFAVQFTNTTPDLNDYEFWWDFGDGTTIQSNNLNVFHEYTSNGLFSVTLYASDPTSGCADTIVQTDYIFTTGQSAIHENELVAYQIHPNPTTNLITIQFEKPISNSFMIFDQQGREVIKGKLSGKQTEVSLENLSNGTYSIQIEGNFKPRVVVKQ